MLLFSFSKIGRLGVGQSISLIFLRVFLRRKAKNRVKYYYKIFLKKTEAVVLLRQNLLLFRSEGALEFTTMS